MTTAEFKTTHDLPFLSAHWNNPFNSEGWQVFKIGTCNGQWTATKESYDILLLLTTIPEMVILKMYCSGLSRVAGATKKHYGFWKCGIKD